MGQMVSIDDSNFMHHINPIVNGEKKMTGLRPRNYRTHPVGYSATAPSFSMPIIPKSQYEALIAKKNAEKSWLSDIRDRALEGKPIPSRDQNGRGYCWFHSGVSANLLCRARDNQPYADLSAYSGACIIKNFADEGGWGLEGVEWEAENGCATSKTWPQQGTKRSYDTPAMREEAKLYRMDKWMDMQPNNIDQLITCLLSNIPVVVDYNWWSHSVCACRLVSVNPLKIWIWNSWGDSWSDNGMGELVGSKASPDGQVCPISIVYSQAA